MGTIKNEDYIYKPPKYDGEIYQAYRLNTDGNLLPDLSPSYIGNNSPDLSTLPIKKTTKTAGAGAIDFTLERGRTYRIIGFSIYPNTGAGNFTQLDLNIAATAIFIIFTPEVTARNSFYYFFNEPLYLPSSPFYQISFTAIGSTTYRIDLIYQSESDIT